MSLRTEPVPPLRRKNDRPPPTAAAAISERITNRIASAIALLRQERWPRLGSHLSIDNEIATAWGRCHERCRREPGRTLMHIDSFLSDHASALVDLVWRARRGRASGALLDDIATALENALPR